MFKATSSGLFTRSFRVLTANRKLLIFPVVGLLCDGLIATFADPGGLRNFTSAARWSELAQKGHAQAPVAVASLLSVRELSSALASSLCLTFLGVALYSEVLKALAGDAVSVRAGLSFAASRWRAVATWSLFAFAINAGCAQLHTRSLPFSAAAMLLWYIATLFVTPIIVRDPSVNPLRILRISGAVLRRTWQRTAYGFMHIVVRSLLPLLLFAPLAIGAVRSPAVLIVGGLGFLVYFTFLKLVYDIYRAALYVYATEGVIPRPYSEFDMDAAWQVELPNAMGKGR